MNAKDVNSTNKTNLYRSNFDGTDEPELLLSGLNQPRDLVLDSTEDVAYYWLDKDLWRYDKDYPDQASSTGDWKRNLGYYHSLFFWEDTMYVSDNNGIYKVPDYYYYKIDIDLIMEFPNV